MTKNELKRLMVLEQWVDGHLTEQEVARSLCLSVTDRFRISGQTSGTGQAPPNGRLSCAKQVQHGLNRFADENAANRGAVFPEDPAIDVGVFDSVYNPFFQIAAEGRRPMTASSTANIYRVN